MESEHPTSSTCSCLKLRALGPVESPDSLNFSICKTRVIPKGPRAIVRLPLFTEMSIVPQASEEQRGYRKAEGPPGNFLKGHTKP